MLMYFVYVCDVKVQVGEYFFVIVEQVVYLVGCYGEVVGCYQFDCYVFEGEQYVVGVVIGILSGWCMSEQGLIGGFGGGDIFDQYDDVIEVCDYDFFYLNWFGIFG